jgi:protein-tyrosine phosphatase
MRDASEPRVMKLSGIHNFRDYGGYAASGGRLRRGRLYRSGQHYNASLEDLAKVGAIGLASVVDLRGDAERATAPCKRPAGFAARVVFASDDKIEMAPHLEAGRAIKTFADADAAMCASYGEMPYMDRLVRATREYFVALASEDGPVLVHCMAGKDRTGISVALLHAMLGVHRDDMIADYVLTNTANSYEERVAVGGATLRSYFGNTLDEDAIEHLCSAAPQFLEAALAAMAARNGGVDGYLDQVIGVTPAMRGRIAERLVEA